MYTTFNLVLKREFHSNGNREFSPKRLREGKNKNIIERKMRENVEVRACDLNYTF